MREPLHETNMTMGKLREYMKKAEKLPDDAIVYIQRIEDYYFENNGWTTEEYIYEDYPPHNGYPGHTDYSNYIRASFAHASAEDEEPAFLIEAHY